MHVSLIVPAPFSTLPGAYTYDRRMIEGLRALGHTVQVVELAGRLPDADQPAINAAHTAWSELAQDSVPVIDGAALPAFSGLAAALGPRRVTALVHHPASLETTLSDETRQRLHRNESAVFQAVARLVVTSEPTLEQMVARFGVERDRVAVIAPGIGEPPRSRGTGPRSGLVDGAFAGPALAAVPHPGAGLAGAPHAGSGLAGPLSADHDTAGTGCAILSIGPLIPRKGHDVLLRALSRLFDLDWTLTIAGATDLDPVHAQGLLALAEELHIDQHVRFAGAVDDATMETLWQDADMFALASWFEGYGMALAEALRRGLPVAVTATGAAPTLVGPEAGVVCPPGDVPQLSKALRRLIFDRTLRRDMAEVAWQAARALPSWHDQAVRLAAVLAEDPPAA